MRSCPHRPPCPGCPRYGRPGLDSTGFEALRAFTRAHRLAAPKLVEGPVFGFRHRARLAVRGRVGAPQLGLFEAGTHHVVHIPQCGVHHPLINRVAAAVREEMIERRVSTYSETTGAGLIRYLQIAVERRSQAAQLVVVTNSASAVPLKPLVRGLERRLGSQLHSLFWNGNVTRTNAILGAYWERLVGAQALRENFGGPDVFYPPHAFGQNNLDLAERLVNRIGELIPQGSSVLELYAGVGAIGLSVVDRTRCLLLNELGEGSLEGLHLGLAALGPEQRSRIRVHEGPAQDARHWIAEADVVVVDPPRKGLDALLVEELRRRPPSRLVYVSCGLDSFLRDAEELTQDGRLVPTSVEAYAMFPFTRHVETLTVFERSRSG